MVAEDPSPAFEGEVASGDRRRALTALRGLLAERLAEAEPKETAGLAKQLADVMRELDDMPVAEERSVVSDIRKRADARRSAAGL